MDKKIVKGTVLDINGLIDYAEDGYDHYSQGQYPCCLCQFSF